MAESALIACDDIEAIFALEPEKARLQGIVEDSSLHKADKVQSEELRSLMDRLHEQDHKNTLELKRHLADVKQEMEKTGKLQEWSKSLSKTVGNEPGGLKDLMS